MAGTGWHRSLLLFRSLLMAAEGSLGGSLGAGEKHPLAIRAALSAALSSKDEQVLADVANVKAAVRGQLVRRRLSEHT